MTIFCTNCDGGIVLGCLCNTCGKGGQSAVFRGSCYCVNKGCITKDCRRRLSRAVEKEAEGSGLPLAVADYSNTCLIYKGKRGV